MDYICTFFGLDSFFCVVGSQKFNLDAVNPRPKSSFFGGLKLALAPAKRCALPLQAEQLTDEMVFFYVFYGSSQQNRHHLPKKNLNGFCICLNMSFNEHGNLLLSKGHPCGRLCVVKPSKNPGEAKTLGLTNMPDYQAHGSLLLKFLKGVPRSILDGSGDLCFLIKITQRNTRPSLGSSLFVTLKKKQRDFEAKI